MNNLYVFTVMTKDECCFTINLLFKDLKTGEEKLLTGLNEYGINSRNFDTAVFNKGKFKVGDKGLLTYTLSLRGNIEYRFYTLNSMRMKSDELRVKSKGNHIFYDDSNRMYMLPTEDNIVTEAVLVNIPAKLKHEDGVTLRDDYCVIIDNDVFKVKEFNDVKTTENENYAETMRKRANRLIGLFDD